MTERNIIDVYKQIKQIIGDENIELMSELDVYINSLINSIYKKLRTCDMWIGFINILNLHYYEINENKREEINKILLNEN